MRFLVVDDSKIARRKATDFIVALGYEVVAEAGDGVEAIEKYKECTPDVMLIDLEMPNMNGIEASEAITKINPDLIIILITSVVNKTELINALRIGVNKVIMKPLSQDLLDTALNELLKRG